MFIFYISPHVRRDQLGFRATQDPSVSHQGDDPLGEDRWVFFLSAKSAFVFVFVVFFSSSELCFLPVFFFFCFSFCFCVFCCFSWGGGAAFFSSFVFLVLFSPELRFLCVLFVFFFKSVFFGFQTGILKILGGWLHPFLASR